MQIKKEALQLAKTGITLPGYWAQEKEGDFIRGSVVDLDRRSTKYRDGAIVVTLEVLEDSTGKFQVGEQAEVWCHDTVLDGEMRKRRPNIGDEITVTYLGWHRSERYKMWRVRGGAGAAFDWDADAPARTDDFDEDDGPVPF